MRCVSNTIPSTLGTFMRTGPTLHSVPLQTLLCLHSDDPRRHAACAPPVGFRRVGAPQPLQKPTGVQHGCGARSPGAPAQPALHLRREAQRSGVRWKRRLGCLSHIVNILGFRNLVIRNFLENVSNYSGKLQSNWPRSIYISSVPVHLSQYK